MKGAAAAAKAGEGRTCGAVRGAARRGAEPPRAVGLGAARRELIPPKAAAESGMAERMTGAGADLARYMR